MCLHKPVAVTCILLTNDLMLKCMYKYIKTLSSVKCKFPCLITQACKQSWILKHLLFLFLLFLHDAVIKMVLKYLQIAKMSITRIVPLAYL